MLPFVQGWADSADPRKRQFNIKQGENEEMKREISEIEAKRVDAHHVASL